jgi:hypothetical protein
MAGDFSYAFKPDTVAVEAVDGKYAEATLFNKGPSIAPISDLTKAPLLDSAGQHGAHLVDLHDRMQDVAAVKEAEQAGLGRDLERESGITDPATGDPLTIGRDKATGFDSGIGGPDGVDPWSKGKGSSLTDPMTGQPLLGGDGGGASGPSQEDAMAAGRAGRGRAMSDGDDEVVTDDTSVKGPMTFQDAVGVSLGTTDGVTVSSDDGSHWTFRSAIGDIEGQPVTFLWVTHDRPGEDPVTVVYVEGEKGPWVLRRPRPDDDGGTPPRKLTEAEKRAILVELRSGFGPAGQPRPDDDGVGTGGSGGTGEVLTYLDLAGQPRPDDEHHGGGATPRGPVMTGLGLAGQPVGDDPNFGVVTPGVGGLQPPSPGFGGGLVIDNGVADRIDDGRLGT